MTIAGEDSRPLLPTDEYQIASQLAKKHGVVQRGSANFSIRSSSNRNISHLYVKKPAPLEKALTDTDNFIEIHAKRAHQMEGSEDESKPAEAVDGSSTYSLESEDASEKSLGEGTASTGDEKDYLDLGHQMDLDPRLKKQREEWAERGAAKILREVTNPETGKTTKHVVKKGIKDFIFGDTLGDGSYSTVLLATSKESGKKYAVKVLSKEYLIRQKKVKYVNIEKSALQRLNNSRGIIKLFFTFQDESSLYFLLEYAPNGDFLSVMKKFGSLSEECACYYAAQIIDSISLLHSRGIIHRDMKPENILLDKNMKIKLTDFGTAKILDPEPDSTDSFDLFSRSKSFVGTAEYVSPELLNDNYVDFRCDIWAFGCILFQMIAGKPPFKATNEYLTFQKVMKVQYAFTAGFPLVIRDLVKGILVKQPDQRLTIPQIQKHHFFKDVNFKDGSIWERPAPEIQPYKVNAKSMQPIPALSTSTGTSRRPVLTRPYAKSTSNLPSNSGSSGSSNLGKLPPASATPTQKKALDERTAQILRNAKRAVGNRKIANQNRRTTSGAASAASVALAGKVSDPPSPMVTIGSQSSALQHRTKPPATYRSSSSLSSPQMNGSDLPSKSPPAPSGTTSSSAKAPSSQRVASEKTTSHTMNKTDVIWSYYLKNIDEHVLGVGEISLAVTTTDYLEKRVSKAHGSLDDPVYVPNSSKTRLSQVVRAGGDVTGFRTDSNQSLPAEATFYEQTYFDHDNVSMDYKKPGGELPQSPTSERKVAGSPVESNGSDDVGNLAITEKFKKLFHHSSNKLENVHEPIETGDFFKRMLLVTNHGRCLVLLKKLKSTPGTAANYQSIYDIDLCQQGTRLKEITLPAADNDYRMFAIQTPYNSFVCKTSKESIDSWLRTISGAMRSGHGYFMAKFRKGDNVRSEAFAAARLASPGLTHGARFSDRGDSSSTVHPSSPSKAFDTGSPNTSVNDSKQDTNGGTSATAKSGRFFESFINSRERTSKKHASPVPLPTKLVNGLPPVSSPTSLRSSDPHHDPGSPAATSSEARRIATFGVPDHHHDPGSPAATAKEARKIVTTANSRLLARSEQSLRSPK
ncbi:hypothetical protein HG536_0G01930 [Torulaspora globosa]|uniref:non-specific serine/threonine protein kinase n=1 Tax=Torulaspora globosa TaxID=48254 RepID=A0A7G3ZLE8_9SACH|nr:uncharacterized protein HG536_0G01930 [Torulaspora globosa]QLL34334.1 hypothetical protein HG536_0G01930 [Torulaspora globosa]